MAEQTARNWNSGDIITAANLNLIERGVSAMAEDYTPTTWANGNTVTAANLNNIEQGIAGGGGSSDFSTANVTIVNSLGRNTALIVPSISEDYALVGGLMVPAGETATIKVPLIDNYAVEMYSGETGDKLNTEDMGGKLTVTDGNAENDANNIILIHGDCTITISLDQYKEMK